MFEVVVEGYAFCFWKGGEKLFVRKWWFVNGVMSEGLWVMDDGREVILDGWMGGWEEGKGMGRRGKEETSWEI